MIHINFEDSKINNKIVSQEEIDSFLDKLENNSLNDIWLWLGDEKHPERFYAALMKTTCISKVSLWWSCKREDSFHRLLEVLNESHVSYLNVSSHNRIGITIPTSIISFIAHCKIPTLDLDGCVESCDMESLSKALEVNTGITTLSIGSLGAHSTEAYIRLAQAISRMKNLRHIDTNYLNSQYVETVGKYIETIMENPSLIGIRYLVEPDAEDLKKLKTLLEKHKRIVFIGEQQYDVDDKDEMLYSVQNDYYAYKELKKFYKQANEVFDEIETLLSSRITPEQREFFDNVTKRLYC